MQTFLLRSRVDARTGHSALKPCEAEALAFILPLSTDYPEIERWYREKVVPGLRDGTRTLVRVERGDDLVGLGIGKIEGGERKNMHRSRRAIACWPRHRRANFR